MLDVPGPIIARPAGGDAMVAAASSTGPGSRELRMGSLAKDWHARRRDIAATVDAITADAVRVISGADSACIVRLDRRSALTCWGATDAVALSASQLEQQVQQGPSSTALTGNVVIRINELATDPRWPAFCAGTTDLGVGSILSVPLECDGRVVAVLTAFGGADRAFTADAVVGAESFAEHAAVALANAQERADLSAAIDGRTVIGQAKGILMERYRLTDAQAFRLLVKASQQTNVPLREIADSLSTSGTMPGEPRR